MLMANRFKALTFTLVLFSFSVVLCAQPIDSTNQSKVILPPNEQLHVEKHGYFISNITDLRTNKNNNGYLKIENEKYSLIFKDSLVQFAYSLFKVTNNDTGNLKPLEIQIEKFRVFASTKKNIDEAQLYIKATFKDKSDVAGKILYTFERTLNYKKQTQPNFLGNFIFTAFRLSISNLKTTSSSYKKTYNIDQIPSVKKSIIIPQPLNQISWEHPTYFLSNSVDARIYKESEGELHTGFFNQRVPMELEARLESYMNKLIRYDSSHNKIPLTLYITQFNCKASPMANGTRHSILISGYLKRKDTTNQVVYGLGSQCDTLLESENPLIWPDLIAKCVKNYFAQSPHKLIDTVPRANMHPIPTNVNLHEIRIVKKDLGKHYYSGQKELTRFKDFKVHFESPKDSLIKRQFTIAQSAIVTGRVIGAVGGFFCGYWLGDFLASENNSFKEWYHSSNSKLPLLASKKTMVWTSISATTTGIILELIGHSLLDEAISKYNRSLYRNLSFNISPNFNSSSYMLDLRLNIR